MYSSDKSRPGSVVLRKEQARKCTVQERAGQKVYSSGKSRPGSEQFRKEQARKCIVQERAPQEGKCTVCSEKNGQESVQFMKRRLRRKKFREE